MQPSPAISADGRYVAFRSACEQPRAGRHQRRRRRLRPRPPDGHDRAGERRLGRRPGRRTSSYCPAISADGRYVAFESVCDQPRAGRHQRHARTSSSATARRHDRARERQLGAARRATTTAFSPRSRADGRYVAFSARTPPTSCRATPTATSDVFVRDRAGRCPQRHHAADAERA